MHTGKGGSENFDFDRTSFINAPPPLTVLIKLHPHILKTYQCFLRKIFISYRDTSADDDEDDDDMFDQVASFKGVARSYELNFAPGIRNLHARLETAVREGANRLATLQRTGRSLKYYMSLRCNFYKPAEPDTVTDEPCAFNSGTSTLLPSSSIKTQMEINYISILQAVENFERNGSGEYLSSEI